MLFRSSTPVSSPMPWDQIQDAPVTIPPADVAVSFAVEPLVSPLPWDLIQDASVSIPPADGVLSAVVESPGEFSVAPVEISDEVAAQNAPVVSTVSQEELTAVVPPGEIPESTPGSVSQAEPAVSPMSWDHVQQTPATISSAELTLNSAVEPLVEAPAARVASVDIPLQEATREARSEERRVGKECRL